MGHIVHKKPGLRFFAPTADHYALKFRISFRRNRELLEVETHIQNDFMGRPVKKIRHTYSFKIIVYTVVWNQYHVLGLHYLFCILLKWFIYGIY